MDLTELRASVVLFLLSSPEDPELDGIRLLNKIQQAHSSIHQMLETVLERVKLDYCKEGRDPEEVVQMIERSRKYPPPGSEAQGRLASVRNLRKSLGLPERQLAKRLPIAHKVIEFLTDEANRVEAQILGSNRGGGWSFLLWQLHMGYPHVTLAPGTSKGLDFDRSPPGNVWIAMRRSKEWSELATEIEALQPPMTWSEVLYHIFRALEEDKRNPDLAKQRQQLLGGIRKTVGEMICFECDIEFYVDKHNPYRLACSRCHDKWRKNRQREGLKQRNNSSAHAPM